MLKKFYLLLALLVLILAILGGYFYQKIKVNENPLIEPPVNVGTKQIVVLPTDKVKKSIGVRDGNKVITYVLEGSFQTDFKNNAGMIETSFTIKNDPKKRTTMTFLGTNSKSILFGEYESDFNGDSSWKLVSTDELYELVEIGTDVQLTVEYIVDPNLNSSERIAVREKVLDAYIESMQTGRYDSVLPTNFILYSHKLGVIKRQNDS